ncbi:MAG: alpha/beta hydrolase family protein [Ardenticatenaceae bacterium]
MPSITISHLPGRTLRRLLGSFSILYLPAPHADARLRYGSESLQFGDLRLPSGDGPHPVVLVIHGGFWRAKWDLSHMGHFCHALTAEGFATWSLEYRRVGNAGGGWPGTFLDVARGADFLGSLVQAYNLDLTRVAALGHSAGGHLALWLAARRRLDPNSPLYLSDPLPLQSVIALAAVSDLRWASRHRLGDDGLATHRLMGGPPTEYPARYDDGSPVELLPFGVPQHLLHGTADSAVPFELSRHYYDAARSKGDPVTLTSLPSTGHFELIDPASKEWTTVLRAVQTLTE